MSKLRAIAAARELSRVIRSKISFLESSLEREKRKLKEVKQAENTMKGRLLGVGDRVYIMSGLLQGKVGIILKKNVQEARVLVDGVEVALDYHEFCEYINQPVTPKYGALIDAVLSGGY